MCVKKTRKALLETTEIDLIDQIRRLFSFIFPRVRDEDIISLGRKKFQRFA